MAVLAVSGLTAMEALFLRDTGVTTPGDAWPGGGLDLYTKQVYKEYIGDFETYSENDVADSNSCNGNFEQANMIFWYQDDTFQDRLAENYRSKRAVSQNYAGISGWEMYQKSTFYLDASARL